MTMSLFCFDQTMYKIQRPIFGGARLIVVILRFALARVRIRGVAGASGDPIRDHERARPGGGGGGSGELTYYQCVPWCTFPRHQGLIMGNTWLGSSSSMAGV